MGIERVGLVTCRRLPDLTPDDRVLAAELRRRGIEATPLIWDDDSVAWDAFDRVIVRSCWDYYLHADKFRPWLDRLAACGAHVLNPVPVLRDNMHKGYLRRLANAGVATAPTAWVPQGEPVDLVALLRARRWPRAVVKPAVSAGAHQTWIVDAHEAADKQALLDDLTDTGDVLVQAFLPAIETQGEWSLIFFDGVYSHAVLKTPQAGEFRVQAEHGGATRAAVAPAAMREQCASILDLIDEPLLYARVDGLDLDGTFTLMELELIEPELFFRNDPQAAARLADTLLARSA
jgi:glutathione synthase/RimK-type ligase-like ATP-grasp enzyme